MAKPLIFQLDGQEISVALNKVDRSKLYGYKEIEVLDEADRPCELATLAGDGRTVVGKGGTGLGYLSADGHWCDKSQLKPVDLEGNEITPVGSSFSEPIEVGESVSYDEYLTHNIRLVYMLTSDDEKGEKGVRTHLPERPSGCSAQTSPDPFFSLLDELKSGKIYKFPYSYRGGLQADAGFLLLGDDGNVFLAVGDPTKVEFIGLQQLAAIVEEEGEAEETDLMDFDMI